MSDPYPKTIEITEEEALLISHALQSLPISKRDRHTTPPKFRELRDSIMLKISPWTGTQRLDQEW